MVGDNGIEPLITRYQHVSITVYLITYIMARNKRIELLSSVLETEAQPLYQFLNQIRQHAEFVKNYLRLQPNWGRPKSLFLLLFELMLSCQASITMHTYQRISGLYAATDIGD